MLPTAIYLYLVVGCIYTLHAPTVLDKYLLCNDLTPNGRYSFIKKRIISHEGMGVI